MPDDFDAAYWEQRYSSHEASSHRAPGPQLAPEVEHLPAGTALEAGCGEGANAIWLAEHGWQVTAVDISATAIERARTHAEARGPGIAGRITWVAGDLAGWEPPHPFDLVSSHYVHPRDQAAYLRRLADLVAPGGTLLVVDHDHADEHAHAHQRVDELASPLDPGQWTVELAETRSWTMPNDDRTMHDSVLRARRSS